MSAGGFRDSLWTAYLLQGPLQVRWICPEPARREMPGQIPPTLKLTEQVGAL